MPKPRKQPSSFSERLIAWQRHAGRHDLPWQATRDPYRIWLSEIMLQQTQVTTVIPYYARFLERFANLAALAAAPVTEVMALWSGLGYYARARNLHACAQAIVAQHGGVLPREPAAIAALPGIGRSTANAIAVFCFGARQPILDGNVKRVLCRHAGIAGYPGAKPVEHRLWQLAEALLPARHADLYIQAQMDLGATICTRSRPRCEHCPIAADCVAKREQRIAELPTPRPRPVIPERQATLLALVNEGRVLLQRRPPSGIWGGLLSLPELPDGKDLSGWLGELGYRLLDTQTLPPATHAFTHFRLHIRPIRCRVEPLPGRAAEPAGNWLGPKELPNAALPAPVRRLLAALT